MIRVLVVDDTAVARLYLKTILESEPDIQVIGEAENGLEGVRKTHALKPDVITMDIRMPVMDGFQAIQIIMSECPTPIIVVSSSIDESEMKHAFQALQAGALSIVEKPRTREGKNIGHVRTEILHQVRILTNAPLGRKEAPTETQIAVAPPPKRKHTGQCFDVMGLACSTGGPQTLQSLFSRLKTPLPVPVLAVQHISKGFIEGMVNWLDRSSPNLTVKLACHGEKIEAGTVYFAPDDRHLVLGADWTASLTSAPLRQGFRPSADVLFESLANIAGDSAVGLVMTGMGNDGAAGLSILKGKGGYVIAQNRESSIIFGMPRSAIELGVVDAVVSLEAMPELFDTLFEKKQLTATGKNHPSPRK